MWSRGECDLQDISVVFGSDKSRFYEFSKRAVFDKNVGSFVKMVMTRCIHCTRCVRFLNEICESYDLGMLERGAGSEISTFIFKILSHEMSANIIDLCPVGALTSKPYAFSSRPWELNSLESIDILDSMCSSIRLDYLNNKLMRILPIYNKNINEDWITNKIRFIYDSNLYQRIHYPVVKVDNVFVNISWINAFNLFFFNLLKFSEKFVNVVVGGLSDYESIFNIKQFFNLLGNNIFFESNIKNFDSDFLSDIYTLLNLDDIKILLIISLNLRLEMPILNSKLLRKKDKISFYSLGNIGYFYSNSFKFLGNSVMDVVNFIYGKTLINKEIFNIFSFDLNIFNTRLIKPIGLQILIGQSFYFIKNSFMLFNRIKSYVVNTNKMSSCNNLFSNVGILNYLNINYLKKFTFNYSCSSLYFLNNVDNFNFLKFLNKKKDNFLVYRGSFFDEGAKCSDLVFPCSTFFEESLNYKNFSGLNLFTKQVISTPFYNNKEFFFLLNNLKWKFFKLNLFGIINFKVLFKYFKFLHLDFCCKNFILNSSILKLNYKNNKILIENKIFNSVIINYYKSDVYSRNSKNISLASLEYLKTIITYIK